MQEHVKYGFWTIPVGKVKEGQDIAEGLRKEILEECNLQVQTYNQIDEKVLPYERNGVMVTVISHLFEILTYSGEMKNMEPGKHRQQVFLSIEEIKKLTYLSDMTLLFLEQIGFKRKARI